MSWLPLSLLQRALLPSHNSQSITLIQPSDQVTSLPRTIARAPSSDLCGPKSCSAPTAPLFPSLLTPQGSLLTCHRLCTAVVPALHVPRPALHMAGPCLRFRLQLLSALSGSTSSLPRHSPFLSQPFPAILRICFCACGLPLPLECKVWEDSIIETLFTMDPQ